MSVRSAIAIILARGGSKGLPRKNVLPVAGRPCVWWTIECAKQSRRVRRVIVSTDDDEIGHVATSSEADWHRRSIAASSDLATVDAAAREVLAWLKDEGGRRLEPMNSDELIVILYGNVPVRPPGLIDRAIELLDATGCDSVQSYAPVGKFHPWWMVTVEHGVERGGGRVRPWEGTTLNHGVYRRQDLPAAYIPDGGVIAVRQKVLLAAASSPEPHAFFGDDRRAIINSGDHGSVVDIDNEVDLHVADAMLRRR